MDAITDSDLKRYLERTYKIPSSEAFQEVKQRNRRRKKLYDHEYISYVCGKLGLNVINITDKIKKEFSCYDDFYKFNLGEK